MSYSGHLVRIVVYQSQSYGLPDVSWPSPARPEWDGKQFVLHVESGRDGKRVVFHEMVSDITPTSFTQTADSGESGTH